jgi:hypothetical protein
MAGGRVVLLDCRRIAAETVSAGLDALSDEPAVSSADAIALLIEHAHLVQGRDLEP